MMDNEKKLEQLIKTVNSLMEIIHSAPDMAILRSQVGQLRRAHYTRMGHTKNFAKKGLVNVHERT